MRILDHDWRESRGIAWARAQCTSLFEGEDFFLQLDSHHRFVEGWDDRLLRHVERSGSSKPVLTAYARSLDLDRPGVPRALPRIGFGRWDGHIPLFRPAVDPTGERVARPTRARSISAHFCFSVGDFVRDVPCDPDIHYYGGAEITVAVRAFTCGYDLFHPPEPILSHAYASARPDRRTHGGDHDGWWRRARASKERIVRFLTDPHTGDFGCGTVRTVADYEAYAGLSFRHCRAQDSTHRDEEPPDPDTAPGWAEAPQPWNVRLRLRASTLPAGFAEADAWLLAVRDALGRDVHHEVLDRKEVARLLEASPEGAVELTFRSAREPAAWSLRADAAGTDLETVNGFVGRRTRHGHAAIEPAAASDP